jgi:hypothetical protein
VSEQPQPDGQRRALAIFLDFLVAFVLPAVVIAAFAVPLVDEGTKLAGQLPKTVVRGGVAGSAGTSGDRGRGRPIAYRNRLPSVIAHRACRGFPAAGAPELRQQSAPGPPKVTIRSPRPAVARRLRGPSEDGCAGTRRIVPFEQVVDDGTHSRRDSC